MKFRFCVALATLVVALGTSATYSHAGPTPFVLPLGTSYKSYAEGNTETLGQPKDLEKTVSRGLEILSVHEDGLKPESQKKRIREISRGYLTVSASRAETTLRVPLGWYAFESPDDPYKDVVISPGQTIRITARAKHYTREMLDKRNGFENFTNPTLALAQTRLRLKNQGFEIGPMELLELPDEKFVLRALHMTKGGKAFSYLERFDPRATTGQRARWWREHDARVKARQGERFSDEPLPPPISLSLLAPTASFEKYLGLFGLMVRDTGLNWPSSERLTLEGFLELGPDAVRSVELVDEAVALIKAGDVETFVARLPKNARLDIDWERKDAQRAVPILRALPDNLPQTDVLLFTERDPEDPVFEASIERRFGSDKTYPHYIVNVRKIDGVLKVTGIGAYEGTPDHS